jgi:hypothetical protein
MAATFSNNGLRTGRHFFEDSVASVITTGPLKKLPSYTYFGGRLRQSIIAPKVYWNSWAESWDSVYSGSMVSLIPVKFRRINFLAQSEQYFLHVLELESFE